MRALTTRSTLTRVTSRTNYPRCFTEADSSTPASDSSIYYNSGATTGDCGYYGYNCACQCPTPRNPAPPLPPPPPSSPPLPPPPPPLPPYAPFAWTTFSSGADCEANGCVTPSSEAECEDAMRALTTKSTLPAFDTIYPRCFTSADSSTPASNSSIYYNSGATTGDCGMFGQNCACRCAPSPPAPPLPPPAPPPPPDMCECTGVGNQISCSGTGVRYCSSAEECFAPPGTPYPFGQWSDLCKQSRRRLQQSSA